MRYKIQILCLAVICLLAPQIHAQTSAAPVTSQPAFEPQIISSFDHGLKTVTVTDGSWQIDVSETSLQLSRPGSSEHYPWKTHTGWFVFIESNSRVWAYDGEHELLLSTVEKHGNSEGWTDYDSPKFPCGVPSKVYSRLSAAAQKAIPSHD